MSDMRVKDYLDAHDIAYDVIFHSKAYRAQEIAHNAHVPGRELAKTVMVKVDGEICMAVLQATCMVDSVLLKDYLHAKKVEVALESDFNQMFPDCMIGAMPPFGNLYGIKVFVDKQLTEDKWIAFNIGSHTELLGLAYKDFARLVKPKVLSFAAKIGCRDSDAA